MSDAHDFLDDLIALAAQVSRSCRSEGGGNGEAAAAYCK